MVSGELTYLAAQEHNKDLLRRAERERLIRSNSVRTLHPDEEAPHTGRRLHVWWQARGHRAAVAR
jgi:hypothetical protein